MKANVSFKHLWYNPSARGFFFRAQSERTLNKLYEKTEDFDAVLERIDSYAEEKGLDLDDIEEMFYSFGDNSVEELAAEFGIELQDDEEED